MSIGYYIKVLLGTLITMILLGLSAWNLGFLVYWACAFTFTGNHLWLIGAFTEAKLGFTCLAAIITAIAYYTFGSSVRAYATEELVKAAAEKNSDDE